MFKVLEKIDVTVSMVENYIGDDVESSIYQNDLKQVLARLKSEILVSNKVSEVVLRGFNDVCTMTAIHFENTVYNDPLFVLRDELMLFYPDLDALPLLGKDFGDVFPR